MLVLNPTYKESDSTFYQFIIPKPDDGFFTDPEKHLLIFYSDCGLSLEDFIGCSLSTLLNTRDNESVADALLNNLVSALKMDNEPISFYLSPDPDNDVFKNELHLLNIIINDILNKLSRLLRFTASYLLKIGKVDNIDVMYSDELEGYEVDVWYVH